MAALNVCTVCGGRYRGLYPLHAGTARHQAAVHRRTKSNVLGKDQMGTKAARRRAAVHQARREPTLAHYRESMELVRAHRRSPPYDGTRKIVKIRRYVRGRPEFETQHVTLGGERYVVKSTARNRRTVAVVPEQTFFRRMGWA